MAETLNKNIRLSSSVKERLDDARGNKSASSFIGLMLDFFDKTGENPRHIYRNPTEKIENRVEDFIKMFKTQERDILKPLFSKVMDGQGESGYKEQLIRLATENQKLRMQLQKAISHKEES